MLIKYFNPTEKIHVFSTGGQENVVKSTFVNNFLNLLIK